MSAARLLRRVKKGLVRTLRKLRFYSMRPRQHEPSGVVSSMKIVPLKQELRMDKSMIKGIAVGGIAMVVLGAGAVTG